MKGLLKDLNPELAKEWHPIKNSKLSLEKMSANNPKIIWWLGKCSHEWESSVAGRNKGYGCPYCAGKKILTGFNDLSFLRPDLSAEWHPTKNLPLLPTKIGVGVRVMIAWKCKLGHEWNALIYARNQGNNCPFCFGVSTLAGFNDLATTNPILASEWHPTKNGNLTPQQVREQSNDFAWWLGATCDHYWKADISSRNKGKGCPICKNKLTVTGINDLAFLNPKLAAEWHPTKNGDLKPSDFGAGSDKKVYWLGVCGHDWPATIVKRSSGTGCPKCSNRISKAEQELHDYIVSLGFIVEQSNRTVLNGKELDVYVPSKKFAIEFNGLYWHNELNGKDKTYHVNKWLACKAVGVELVQIWEDDWMRNKQLVLDRLAFKLGVSKPVVRNQEKSEVVILTVKQAQAFLAKNDIKGFAAGAYYVGVLDDTGIVSAVMVLRKSKTNFLKIVRFVSIGNVVNDFDDLLSYAKKAYSPLGFMVVSDNSMSGDLFYEEQGFVFEKIVEPDYMYISKGNRIPKSEYTLSKFKSNPELVWEDGLSEKKLALLNRLPRIWNAGGSLWVLPVVC
jgi:G:T-mismatch repair DNA endonuclease (very short patch repair protein)